MSPSRLDRVLKHLSSQGYELGPEPSKEFSLEEGDELTLTFHNNIRCPDGDTLPLAYFANLDNEIHFTMKEVDRFLQKQFGSYRGIIQLSRLNLACTKKEATKNKEDRGKIDESRCDVVATHQVSIPKVSVTGRSCQHGTLNILAFSQSNVTFYVLTLLTMHLSAVLRSLADARNRYNSCPAPNENKQPPVVVCMTWLSVTKNNPPGPTVFVTKTRIPFSS